MAIVLATLISSLLSSYEILWLKFFGSHMDPGPITFLLPVVFFGGAFGASAFAFLPRARALQQYPAELALAGLALAFLSIPYWTLNERIIGISPVSLTLAFGACVLWGAAQASLIQASTHVIRMITAAALGALPLVVTSLLLSHYSLGAMAAMIASVHAVVLSALLCKERKLTAPIAAFALVLTANVLGLFPQTVEPTYSNSISTIRIEASDQPPRKLAQVSQPNTEFSTGKKHLPFSNSRIYRNGKYITDLIDAKTLSETEIFKQDELFGFIQGATPGAAAIIGVGGGRDVIQARLAGFKEIFAVEINPSMVQAVVENSRNPELVYKAPEVKTVIADGRDFFRTLDKNRKFDLILLSDVRNYGSALSMHFTENYLLTEEAIQDYIKHLSPGGLLLYRMRGRETKLVNAHFSTALAAIRDNTEDPSDELAIVRRVKNVNSKVNGFVLGYRRGGFSDADKDQIRLFNHRVKFQSPAIINPAKHAYITDDRPYPYWTKSSTSGYWLFAILVAFSFVGMRKVNAPTWSTPALVCGFAFIAIQSLAIEQAVFQSGDPFLTPAFVMAASILASAVGYAFHDRLGRHSLLMAAAALIAAFCAMKGIGTLPLESLARGTLCALVAAVPVVFSSAAYARILALAHKRSSAAAFLALNGFGLLLGGLGAKLLAMEFGATTLALTCSALLTLAAKKVYTSQFDIH